jgi:hypothetical protein
MIATRWGSEGVGADAAVIMQILTLDQIKTGSFIALKRISVV